MSGGACGYDDGIDQNDWFTRDHFFAFAISFGNGDDSHILPYLWSSKSDTIVFVDKDTQCFCYMMDSRISGFYGLCNGPEYRVVLSILEGKFVFSCVHDMWSDKVLCAVCVFSLENQ